MGNNHVYDAGVLVACLHLPEVRIEGIPNPVAQKVEGEGDRSGITVIVVYDVANWGLSLASYDLMALPVSGCNS